MVTRRRGSLGVIAAGLAALLVPGKSPQAHAAAAAQAGQPLEGSWMSSTTVTRAGQQFQAVRLSTYNANGTLISTAPSNAPPLETSIAGTAHGTWVRIGDRQFATTWIGLRFDAAGTFLGIAKARGRIQINDDGDTSSSQTQTEMFDRAGNLVDTASSTGQARRIVIEPLP
jgi:hypothetical protein